MRFIADRIALTVGRHRLRRARHGEASVDRYAQSLRQMLFRTGIDQFAPVKSRPRCRRDQ